MNEKTYRKTIYELVQNTLDFCGNTLEALKEYCIENDLDWRKFEDIRFKATEDFYEKRQNIYQEE